MAGPQKSQAQIDEENAKRNEGLATITGPTGQIAQNLGNNKGWGGNGVGGAPPPEPQKEDVQSTIVDYSRTREQEKQMAAQDMYAGATDPVNRMVNEMQAGDEATMLYELAVNGGDDVLYKYLMSDPDAMKKLVQLFPQMNNAGGSAGITQMNRLAGELEAKSGPGKLNQAQAMERIRALAMKAQQERLAAGR